MSLMIQGNATRVNNFVVLSSCVVLVLQMLLSTFELYPLHIFQLDKFTHLRAKLSDRFDQANH